MEDEKRTADATPAVNASLNDNQKELTREEKDKLIAQEHYNPETGKYENGYHPNLLSNQVRITSETARDYGRAGGIASAKSRREQKDIRELAKNLLSITLSERKAKRALGDDIDVLQGDLSVANILNTRMMQEAVNGNVKAFEVLRDTAGYKPVEQVQADVDIMTAADRALLDKINKRIDES